MAVCQGSADEACETQVQNCHGIEQFRATGQTRPGQASCISKSAKVAWLEAKVLVSC